MLLLSSVLTLADVVGGVPHLPTAVLARPSTSPTSTETTLQNSVTQTADLTVGEVKTYKLHLDVDVCSDPTR